MEEEPGFFLTIYIFYYKYCKQYLFLNFFRILYYIYIFTYLHIYIFTYLHIYINLCGLKHFIDTVFRHIRIGAVVIIIFLSHRRWF